MDARTFTLLNRLNQLGVEHEQIGLLDDSDLSIFDSNLSGALNGYWLYMYDTCKEADEVLKAVKPSVVVMDSHKERIYLFRLV